jgi:para-aminobenzoate synthetase/4-amino-4-deoxychorismate lyase
VPSLDYALIETLVWNGSYPLGSRHLRRMDRSAKTLGFPFDPDRARALLVHEGEVLAPGKQHKVHLQLERAGELSCHSSALPTQRPKEQLTVTVSELRTLSSDTLLFHKTTHRPVYSEAYQRATHEGHADVIFLNERNEVTEGAISNIFVQRGQHLLTPPVRCGLLAGIYRQVVLDECPFASEQVLFVDDLLTADALLICNAVRGWRRVTLASDPAAVVGFQR